MILLAAEHGPWALGWEALVAVGTLLLAGYTARLAFFTRRSVEAARDEQSATWRPVVIPLALKTGVRDLPEEGLTLDVVIVNKGSGPAFDVTARLSENGQVTSPITGGQMTGANGHGILQVDEELRARFPLVSEPDQGGDLTIAYLDLGGRPLWTTARLSWIAGHDHPVEVVAPRLGYGSSR
jgi:hypothetical protein